VYTTPDGGSEEDLVTGIAYLPFGPMTSFTFGNGLERSLSFDDDYRVTNISLLDGVTVLDSIDYTYSDFNEITGIEDNVTSANSETFGYDELHRLISAEGGYGTLDYDYDAVGNRTSAEIDDGVTSFTDTYTYPSSASGNRLLSYTDSTDTRTFTYDNAGNVTEDERKDGSTLVNTFDRRGRLTAIDATGSPYLDAGYAYNAFGQRVIKTVSSVATHYTYDTKGNLLSEEDDTGGVIREYVYVNGERVAIITEDISGPFTAYLSNDHLTAPRVATDSSGDILWQAIREPFGKTTVTTSGYDFVCRFPGQYEDPESGYFYNYFRDYDSEMGRYLESDPIGLRGGVNTYAYVGGSPVNSVDPAGLDTYVIYGAPYPGANNPFGHIAVATDSGGVYSPGVLSNVGMSLQDYLNAQRMRDQTVYVIPTTASQEARINEVVRGLPRRPHKLYNTCAQLGTGALRAGGIILTDPQGWGINRIVIEGYVGMFPIDVKNALDDYGLDNPITNYIIPALR
jgi:RHS repeat-associated protein